MTIDCSTLPVMAAHCKTCPFKEVNGRWRDVHQANLVIERTLFKAHQICHGTTLFHYLYLMEEYYLYKHIREDNGEVFYVGIGTKDRPYNKTDRSKFWKKVVARTKYRVEIILKTPDYNFLKEQEIATIKYYGRRDLGTGTLVNLTDGGQGMLNYVFPPEHLQKLKDNSAFKKNIIHKESGQSFPSITEAAIAFNIKCNTLQYQLLRGSRCDFYYASTGEKPYVGKKEKKVVNITTGEIYENIKIAADSLKINYHTLRSQLRLNRKNCPVVFEAYHNRCKGAFDHNMEIYTRMGFKDLVK